ncbi:MAG: Ig-like domain repeat protein, partial [Actinobacteria bacterium]|nr:Ig-like domain repeat protein [Actinomycetota bacterium]
MTGACNDVNETSGVIEAAVASIFTRATPTATLGNPISDTATVSASPFFPTGTVTFTAFGPDDANCNGAPAFTSGPQGLSGPLPTATSGDFTPSAAGTYNWVAVYSGDFTFPSVTSPCGAPDETSVVTPATATIATSATATGSLNQPLTDTATVTGGSAPAPAPTGGVTFTLYGPNDPTCSGSPVFTSVNRPLAGGPPPTATSDPFTPTLAGTYNWVAAYGGDANYVGVTGACGDPGESSGVLPPPAASIATQATPTATIGSSVTDTATVTGGPSPAPMPTGTVTFTLYGPDDPTCAAAPVFTSAGRPLAGGPPPTTGSDPFTPSAVGTYNWVATYSGDANYASVTTLCGDPAETTVITAPPVATIVTSATLSVPIGGAISDSATVTG